MENLRIVAFPEAGEGVTLFFRNRNIQQLQDHFGNEYQQIVITGLLGLNLETMDKCLEVSAKVNGNPHKVTMDDLDPVPLTVVQEKLLDAFSLCAFGRGYIDQMQWTESELKRMAERGEQNPPVVSPGALPASSDEQPSGQGSAPPTSGT